MPAFGRLPLAYEYVRQGKHTTIIFKFQIPRKKRVEFTRLDTKNINMEGLVFYLSLSFGRHLIKIEAASITDTLPNIVPSTLKPL